ncbi:MAG TPA: phage tail protein [Shinella sp.]|jgi:hypothetical protein|uniref:phage tail protein n=1 Tax=Shinella sp. TaxID=1870904 RepID=UPI002E15FC94|nr:phage tail protein [Shinella sp.]
MTAPIFGMQFSRTSNEPVSVLGPDFSKIIAIEASSDASASEFPLETAVRFSSSDKAARTALGTGPLADMVRGVHDQLNGLNAGADITVVRVAEGEDTAETCAAIGEILDGIGGIPSSTNSTPRIILVGRTDYREDAETMNPVLAKLDAACGKLLAIAPVDVNSITAALAIDDRETLNSQRIMPIGIKARVYEGSTLVTRPMASRIAGLFVRRDNESFGKPFETIANQPILGIAGLSRNIPFSLLDGSTEGQQMLEANVSIVAKGEVGVDGAIADGGFVFIGTDAATTSGDLWTQIHQTRGTDYLVAKMAQITRRFLGPRITAESVEAWLHSIAFMLRDHKAADDILGYTPLNQMFVPNQNSPENIRLGNLKIDVGIETAPAFKRADHEIRRYRPAVEGLVEEIVARLNAVA